MFLNGAYKLRYKQLKTELKNNYTMGMDGYLQYLPRVMKILNIYIPEDGNNTNFRKIPGKDHMGVTFTQTQDKDSKDNKNMNSKE